MDRFKSRLKSSVLDFLIPGGFYFKKKGYCPCCDFEVYFESYNEWLRDYFICSNCRSIPRERALMVIIEKHFPSWKALSIHESSPVMRGTSLKLKTHCKNYRESQFYPDLPKGSIINGTINEDLENQSFNDNSFDIVVTQDVMEHIYHPEKAFSEIARTLKNGGAHVFTVPLVLLWYIEFVMKVNVSLSLNMAFL